MVMNLSKKPAGLVLKSSRIFQSIRKKQSHVTVTDRYIWCMYQVNEVTSSDSESSSPAGTAKSRKSISRELANLALDSPAAANTRPSRRSGRQLLKPKRRGRSVEGLGRDDSDTANMADGGMVPATKLAEVEKKCQDLTNQLRVCFKV